MAYARMKKIEEKDIKDQGVKLALKTFLGAVRAEKDDGELASLANNLQGELKRVIDVSKREADAEAERKKPSIGSSAARVVGGLAIFVGAPSTEPSDISGKTVSPELLTACTQLQKDLPLDRNFDSLRIE